MSIEDVIEKAGQVLIQRLRQETDANVQRLVSDVVESAKRERAAVAQEVRRGAEAEAAKKLETERVRMRAEAEQARFVELQVAHEEAEHALQEKLRAAGAESAKKLAAEVAKATAAAEQVVPTELSRAPGAEEQAAGAGLQRLLESVRALDQARSLSQVLDTLADRTVAEAPRVAVLVVQGARLRGWRFVGFAQIREAGAIDLAVQEAGLIGRAIAKTEVCSVRADPTGVPAGALPPFATLPAHRSALAVPVHVGGQVTAVVYADDATDLNGLLFAGWQSAVEILARHAGHCLETVTAVRVSQLAGGGPPIAAEPREDAVAERPPEEDTEDAARRYARLLLSEIKLYNEAAVKAGREGRDLFERLRPEIERARTLYEERISPSLRARNLYFDQELVRTLADGDSSLLEG